MDDNNSINMSEEISRDVANYEVTSADHVLNSESLDSEFHDNVSFDAAGVPAVTPPPVKTQPMQKRRFASGLAIATSGIGLMMFVAMGALRDVGADGHFSLPAVALCMVIGLMMLGGGFGIMATAAPKFDDDEFERLMRLGDDLNASESKPLPIAQASAPDRLDDLSRSRDRSSMENVAV